MIPKYPVNLFSRPFAHSGQKEIIAPNPWQRGRASLELGFPEETQRPLAQGGMAPNRLDFNGILNMLSSFAAWQQSGGLWKYNPDLNYVSPAMVEWQKVMWWCLKENGPDTENGAITPGENDDYWVLFRDYIFSQTGGGLGDGGLIGLNPVGAVIMFYGEQAPSGYLACDGSAFSVTQYPKLYEVLGEAVLPDFRGRFVRGYGQGSTLDPDGPKRTVGSFQGDAIRNITGEIAGGGWEEGSRASGVFRTTSLYKGAPGTHWDHGMTFDASRVVPTAPENRPANVCLLYAIKHD
ncbi:MAG: phage tail protein [Candidatus Adiutrix sp.]